MILEDKKHFILNIGFWKGMFNSFYFMSCYENQETHKIGRSVCIESSAKEVQSVAILEISSFSRKRFLLKKYNDRR